MINNYHLNSNRLKGGLTTVINGERRFKTIKMWFKQCETVRTDDATMSHDDQKTVVMRR